MKLISDYGVMLEPEEAPAQMRARRAPFAGIALRHGDVIELGHVRFAFALAGCELELPPEFAPISSPPPRGRPASRMPVKAILGLLAILLGGALLLRHPGGDASAAAVEKEARGKTLREAQSGIVATQSEPAAPPRPPAPSPTARPVRAAAVSADAPARKLVGEANRKLMAQDLPGAIALYEQALVLKPRKHLLAAVYRGMGAAFTRQGNIEEGAHYYKLYLPLSSNPAEKAQLQKLLDDYDGRRR